LHPSRFLAASKHSLNASLRAMLRVLFLVFLQYLALALLGHLAADKQ
jgi:hypothetical protein